MEWYDYESINTYDKENGAYNLYVEDNIFTKQTSGFLLVQTKFSFSIWNFMYICNK